MTNDVYKLKRPRFQARADREDRSASCKARKYCRDRGFYTCYECADFEICEKFESLHEGLHYDSCMKNLKAVKEMGLEAWVIGGRNIVTGMKLMIARDACIHVSLADMLSKGQLKV